MDRTSRIVVAPGARAAERRLLAEIERALPPGALPAAAVRVVVPSHSLRQHLLGRLAARRRAWLGLEITTLAGVAAAVLERTGGAPPSGAALEPILIARAAAREPALSRALGGLVRGYDEVGGAVRDLLDAGFVEEHLEAVLERLALERRAAGGAAVERAQAIARVAAAVRTELARLGFAPGAERLAEAARRLRAEPERALPAVLVLVHGFADLTGVGADLLEALVRYRPTVVVLDQPPDLDGERRVWRFGARLLERLSGIAEREELGDEGTQHDCESFRAADPEREAAAAAEWLRAVPDDAPPELSALVARDSTSEVATWARELERRGAPSSAASGPPAALARKIAGLLQLLERGDDTPLGVALAVAREPLESATGAPLADLQLGFGVLGARTFGAAASRSAPAAPVALPLTDRLAAADGGEPRPARRRVAVAAFAAAIDLLSRLRALVAQSARPRTVAAQLASLRRLLRWTLPEGERALLAEALAGLEAFAALELEAPEWRQLVEDAWRGIARAPLGAGGGVALLSVTEARGRTFERLALVGLTRDRFPRAVRPDPLLPDALRLRLRELLPDLPVKAEGHDEERYLFAQLVAAAERTALFRPLADGAGRALAPSPLADELCRGRGLEERPAPVAPAVDAHARAIAAGLARGVEGLERSLAGAIAEAADRFGGERASEALAAARLALLAARLGDPARPDSGLGPFLGVVGPIGELDPRRRPPPVTALERLAGCGWRTFLERLLGLAPLPELGESLPSLPRRLVGTVVHDVLEELARDVARLTLDAARERPPQICPWPDQRQLEEIVRRRARGALIHEALDPALFETTLSREALDLLAVVEATDWAAGSREILAVEVAGEARLEVGAVERRIPFKADRLERLDGEIVLTDYKTGRPLSSAVTTKTRARHLARDIARGAALQLPVYLLGAGGAGVAGGGAARARYLHLRPDLDGRVRELELASADLDHVALGAALEALYAAWDAGAFPPRLLEPDLVTVNPECAFCDVREACQLGDSAARQRLERWASAAGTGAPLDRAARLWWRLRAAASAHAPAETAP